MSTALQPTAAEQALGVSLPSRRDEEWKWTDLKRMVSKPYRRSNAVADVSNIDRLLATSPFAKVVSERVVLVNGVFDESRSRLVSAKLTQHSGQLRAKNPLADLNRALNGDGVTLEFLETSGRPVEIVHVTTTPVPLSVAMHNRIYVGEGAFASVIETFVGEGDYLLSSVTEISMEKGARLDRVKLQNEALGATHLSHVLANLEEDARLNDSTIQLGSSLTRQNGKCTFRGPHAEAKINGTYLLRGEQHVDTSLRIIHAVPHCTSRELFKCVMQDQSRGIFQGKVIVRPDAQKTDGKQSSHALLLSEAAEFDAKPELEIYADDVVCGHGTTCGDLNPDHLFYLMSRGIPKAEARAILVEAFVTEVIDMVENEAVREVLLAQVRERLA